MVFFLSSWTPSILGGRNFFNSIPFFMIFHAQNAPIRGVQALFKHQKQWSPPLGSSLPKCLCVQTQADLPYHQYL
jgi:hypothetical protein